MDGDSIFRRLRGAVGNALVWAGGWFVLGFAGFSALLLTGQLSETMWWADGLLVGARFAVVGAIAGGFFSSAIGLLYRGRRLSEISWARFGIAGAVVTGLFVPVFFQAMNLLSGDGFVPMTHVLDDVPWVAAFGGVAAAVSLWMAQRADAALPGSGQGPLGALQGGERLAMPPGEWDAARRPAAERVHAPRS